MELTLHLYHTNTCNNKHLTREHTVLGRCGVRSLIDILGGFSPSKPQTETD